jgi:hypothetical protein
MKKVILLLLLNIAVRFVNAQAKITDFTESQLKGHVKEVVVFVYRGKINSADVDMKKPEKQITKYDEKGNKIVEDYYDADGKFSFKLLFSYSGDTLITKKQYVDNKLSTEYLFKYDSGGKETEFDTFLRGNNEGQGVKIAYGYDEKGNRIAETQYNFKFGLISNDTLLYDNNGQLVERHIYHGNSKEYDKTVIQYDTVKNEIKYIDYDKNGNKIGEATKADFNIDKNGNWLLNISESKGHSKYQGDYMFKTITKREITYY